MCCDQFKAMKTTIYEDTPSGFQHDFEEQSAHM
jgi:hypothetical protein